MQASAKSRGTPRGIANVHIKRCPCGRSSPSQVLLRRRRHSGAEYGARHDLVGLVERVHDAFHPGFVDLHFAISIPSSSAAPDESYLHHELPNRFLRLLTRRVCRQGDGTLPRGRGPGWRGRLVRGVCRRAGVGVHEKHEFDVAAREEAVDVVVLEGVDALEISVYV